MTNSDIKRLSDKFSELLLAAVGKETIKEINELNEGYDLDMCASHNFIDTNTVMAEAFEAIYSIEPPYPDDEKAYQQWAQISSAAWTVSKICGFRIDTDTRAASLLKDAVYAFNTIPNKKVHTPNFKDTYAIASAIDQYFREYNHDKKTI